MNNTNTAAATLNIGHDVPARFAEEGEKLTLDSFTVLAALKQLGIQVIESACHQSVTEDTTVAAIAVPLSPRQGHLLAELLCQDAIVQFVHGSVEASALYGPKAAEWGPFDPVQFVTLDGDRLNAKPTSVEVKFNEPIGKFLRHTFTVTSGPAAGKGISLLVPVSSAGRLTTTEFDHVRERLTAITGADTESFRYNLAK